MLVEDGIIHLDDEFVSLDNVTVIDIAELGRIADKTRAYYLNMHFIDGSNRVVEMSQADTRLSSLMQLRKLSKNIKKDNNSNFTCIEYALINMDYISHLYYDYGQESLNLMMDSKNVSSINMNSLEAQRVGQKFFSDFYKYDSKHSNSTPEYTQD